MAYLFVVLYGRAWYILYVFFVDGGAGEGSGREGGGDVWQLAHFPSGCGGKVCAALGVRWGLAKGDESNDMRGEVLMMLCRSASSSMRGSQQRWFVTS
jgi:hypothetical protein